MCCLKLCFEKNLALSKSKKLIYNGTRFICALFNKKTEKQKSNKRLMVGTIRKETKKEGQGKAKRHTACKNKKRGQN
jgi:hypothetical protein